MSYLENLVGRPLHEVSEEELEEIIMKGRIAREEEAGARFTKTKTKKVKTPTTVKVASVSIDLDLDDMPD